MPDHVVNLPQAGQILTTAAEQVYAIPELMDIIYALVESRVRIRTETTSGITTRHGPKFSKDLCV